MENDSSINLAIEISKQSYLNINCTNIVIMSNDHFHEQVASSKIYLSTYRTTYDRMTLFESKVKGQVC
jgi:hypothetical protein